MTEHHRTGPLRRHFVARPEEWRVVRSGGPPWFLTYVVYETPSAQRFEWTSRRHRKGLGLRRIAREGGAVEHRQARLATDPRSANVWIGLLFIIGAGAFGLGALPWVATYADPTAVAVTFFVGSLFFTSAALLQHVQTLFAARSIGGAGARPASAARFLMEPGRIDWWVTGVQLAGTLLFNLSTFAAITQLDARGQELLVWLPDVGGSVCFLMASYLGLVEVCHRGWCRGAGEIGWRIAVANLVGSVFFGIAAVGAYVVPDTGDMLNAALANAFIFLGASCFLVGAYLLLLEAGGVEPDPVAPDPSVVAG